MPKLKKQKEVSKPFSLRWKPSEREAIEKNAKKFTGGNITQWLIYAGTNMKPPKKDLEGTTEEESERRDEREQTQ